MNHAHLRAGRAAEPAFPAPNAALLIDFDNVTLGIRSDLTKELRTLLNSDIIKGKVAVQRAYADWRRYPQYIVSLSESSIDLIFAPAFGTTKKNATDIRLAIDAIELIFTRPEIGTFILLSGDSDFSSMVIKLKEYGKYVIGVGIRESASDLLIQNCDEYYSYSDLAGLSRETEVASIQRDPWELVGEAIGQMARNGDVMRSDRLKQVMQQLDPNFDERNAGFNRFSKFVVEAGHRGLLTVSKLENGQYDVKPGDGKPTRSGAKAGHDAHPAPAEAPAAERTERAEPREGRRRRGGRGRGRGRAERDGNGAAAPATRPDSGLTLAAAFRLMTDALAELGRPVSGEQLRARMVSRHGREDELLDTARFGRLLRQANDAEVADVRKGDDEDYEVALPRGAVVPVLAALPPVEAAAPEERPGAPEPTAPATTAPVGRAGLRFRRGSRGSVAAAAVPLVGVVAVESPAAHPPAEPAAGPAKPARKPRGRKAAAAEPAAAHGGAAARPARPRRKKAKAE